MVAGLCEAIHFMLHLLLCTGVECTVISKQESLITVSFTFVTPCGHLRLNNLGYSPLLDVDSISLSRKASVSIKDANTSVINESALLKARHNLLVNKA